MSEHERNFSTVCTRQLKDARNERREFTRNAWILCSVNEPPLQLYPCPSLPLSCERHGRSDSSSFLLRSRHELKKRNSRVFQHFAPFEIFQRPVEETAERIPRGYFRSFTCFRIKERSMGTCPLSCHRKGFIFSSLSRRMCQVVFHFLRDPSVIKCHFFFPSMIDEIIIIIIVATRVYKFFGSWIELFDNNNFNYQRYSKSISP